MYIYVQLEWPNNSVSGSTQQHTSCRPKQIFVLALCLFSTCNVSCPNICICKQQEGQHLDKNSHFLRLHVTENVRAVKSTNCQAANKCRSGVYKPSKSSYREAKLFFTCMCSAFTKKSLSKLICMFTSLISQTRINKRGRFDFKLL